MAEVVLKNIKKVYPLQENKKGLFGKKKDVAKKPTNLQITDEGVVAVQDFNIDIKDNEFIVLVGPSGCGKSTTLRMVAGLEDISGGELYIDGKLCNDVEPKDRDISMVFQSYALYPHLTVYDNIAFPLTIKKYPKDEIDKKVKEAAETLDITQYLDRKPKNLSGGQRQRVAIGRAIVRNPKVLLMDEPLSNLDAKLRNQMRAEIIKLRQKINTTFIYVTHDQVEAMTLGDRIVVMKDGFVQQIGTPQEVFDHPAKNGSYFVDVDDQEFELSKEKQDRLKAKGVKEQDITLGVRPDHMVLADKGIKAKVDVSELMGTSVHLHVTALGRDVIAIVPTEGRKVELAGQEIHLSFSGNVANLFSKEDEKNLEF